MNVLFIEPDRVLGKVIAQALESAGATVAWKHTAQTALDALDQTVPDVIVLEIQLGLHNGIEFLYEIRSYPEWQNIPVIIHTLNAKAEDPLFGESLEQLGVKAVLYKPRTTTVQLVRAVKELVPA